MPGLLRTCNISEIILIKAMNMEEAIEKLTEKKYQALSIVWYLIHRDHWTTNFRKQKFLL